MVTDLPENGRYTVSWQGSAVWAGDGLHLALMHAEEASPAGGTSEVYVVYGGLVVAVYRGGELVGDYLAPAETIGERCNRRPR